MRIDVGVSLNYRGNWMLCTRITNITETLLATDDADTLRSEIVKVGNTYYIESRIEDFKIGDMIKCEVERVELKSPNINTEYIYTKYYFRKVTNDDGHEGSEGLSGEAPSTAVEGSGDGDKSESGVGGSSISQTSSILDGDGQSGEGGIVVHPGEDQGSEYSDANDGSGGAGRP